MKKKKGFTLIELIVAIAILSVCMVGAYNAFAMERLLYVNDRIKVDVQINNQNIDQTLKSEGKEKIGELYNNFGDTLTPNKVKFYIFFNNYNDIKNYIDNRDYSNMIKWDSTNESKFTSEDNDKKLYDTCNYVRTNNVGPNYIYGALIEIDNDSGTNYYSAYDVNVVVWKYDEIWDSDQVKDYQSKTTFYIGR